MAEVQITEDERQLLVMLALQAWVRLKVTCDPELEGAQAEIRALLTKICGVDKVITVRD